MTDMGHGGQAGFSGDVLRLVAASAVAVLLLAGGVYWLHQLPDGRTSPENGSTVQVQLLLTAEPTPYAASEPAEQRPADDVGRTHSDSQLQAKSIEEELVVEEQTTAALPAPAEPRSSVRSPRSHKTAPSSEMALRFQNALLRHIARFQRYPTAARSSGMEGTVRVVFVLQRDGRVLDAWVETSSGKQILDREAVETIFRAAPLPEIPAELPGQMRVLLPVDFALP